MINFLFGYFFSGIMQNKIKVPEVMLLDHSMCINPHQGIVLPLFILLLKGLCAAESKGNIWGITCIIYNVKSKTGSRREKVIQSDQDVQVCGCSCVWVFDSTPFLSFFFEENTAGEAPAVRITLLRKQEQSYKPLIQLMITSWYLAEILNNRRKRSPFKSCLQVMKEGIFCSKMNPFLCFHICQAA